MHDAGRRGSYSVYWLPYLQFDTYHSPSLAFRSRSTYYVSCPLSGPRILARIPDMEMATPHIRARSSGTDVTIPRILALMPILR